MKIIKPWNFKEDPPPQDLSEARRVGEDAERLVPPSNAGWSIQVTVMVFLY
jgi:hypothetical protein